MTIKVYTREQLAEEIGQEKAAAAIRQHEELAKEHGGKPGLIWERVSDDIAPKRRRMITLSLSYTRASNCIRIFF